MAKLNKEEIGIEEALEDHLADYGISVYPEHLSISKRKLMCKFTKVLAKRAYRPKTAEE